MKIFISWSGQRSQRVAELLDWWIQCVIQAVDPWLSSKDIDRGSLWFSEISNQLATTHNGIICLTKSNLNKPWILFEAGALDKGLPTNRVFTFLVDLQSTDVQDPLAQFNHTQPTRESLFLLARSINNGLGDSGLRESILKSVFDTYWPQFKDSFQAIINETPEEDIKEIRPKDDLLNEVLYAVRRMDRRLRQLEDHRTGNEAIESYSEQNGSKAETIVKMVNQMLDKEFSERDILVTMKVFTDSNYPGFNFKILRSLVTNEIRKREGMESNK